MKHARHLLLVAAVLLCSIPVKAQTFWDGTADKSWAGSGTDTDPYLITSAEELAGLAELVNDKENKRDFAGEYFKLTQDLYLTDFAQPDTTSWLEWKPIGRWTDEQQGAYIHHMDTCYFRGHFDGGGHTIHNIYMGTVGEIDMAGPDNPLEGDVIDLSGSCVGFFGFVDGGSISNLTLQNAGIVVNSYYNGGLVSNATNATISNCHLRKSSVVGKICSIGGLIGLAANCVIENCSVEGMSIKGAYVGGLVSQVDSMSVIRNSHAEGVAYIMNRAESGNYGGFGGGLVNGNGGVIENCYADMEMHGNSSTERNGGFVSENGVGGVIRNCYATGDVYQGYQSAGFVARNLGLIESCYSTGNVTVYDDTNYNAASVFVSQQGYYEFYYEVVADIPGTTINCFCTGAVLTTESGGQPAVRGFGGANGATNNRFVNCSFNKDNIAFFSGFGSSRASHGARGYTTAYMQSREFVDDLNKVAALYGTSTWEYRAGQYPVPTGVNATNLRDYLGGGSGTEEDPFLVDTKKHLENFRDYVNFGETFRGMYIRQTADIALNLPRDQWGMQMPETWTPIGTPITSQLHTEQGNWEQRYFRGTYDGGFHKVENMYIDDPVGLPAGLFGALHHGAVIKNLSVTDAYITAKGGDGWVGILAGETSRYANNVYISQCHTSGLVGDPDNSLGLGSAAAIIGSIALEGDNWILNCSSAADVFANDVSAVTRQTGLGGTDTIANFLFTGKLNADGVVRPLKQIPMNQDGFIVTENGYFDSDVYKWNESEVTNYNYLGRSTQYLQSNDFVNILNAYVAEWNDTHSFKLDFWQWQEGDYPCVNPDYQPSLRVTFESYGGSEIAARLVESGSYIQQPEHPVKDGYIFAGWYADAAFTKVFEFGSTPITETMTLYAKWLEPTYDEYDYSIFNNKFATEFHITNKAQLIGFMHAVNGIDGVLTANNFKDKTVYLDCDILLNDTTDWKYWGDLTYAESWRAIGIGSAYCDPTQPFLGTFDGQGHVISGLYIDGTQNGHCWQGLFGFVGAKGEETVIRNLGIQASVVNMRGRTSDVTAGMFVGLLRDGTISQCFAKGKIVADADRSDNDTGGFAGCLGGYYTNTTGGTITDCFAQVDFQYVPLDINAINRGAIGAGMVDYNHGGTISNSYVAASGWEEGVSGGTLSNAYYNKSLNTNAVANSGTGLTDNEMHAKACFVGFDFDSIWGRNDSINNGYPYLRCFHENNIPDSPDPVRVTGIYFQESGKTIDVVMCDSLQLHAKVLPEEASEQQIVWTFEEIDANYDSYLSIDSCGLVTTSYDKRAFSKNIFKVTASTYEGNYEKKCTLNVHKPSIDSRWPNKCRRIGTTEWTKAVTSGVIGWEYLLAYSIKPDSLHQPLTISTLTPEIASVEIISQDTIVPKGFFSGTTEPVRCVLFAVSVLGEGNIKTTAVHPRGYMQTNDYTSITTGRFVDITGIGIEAEKTTISVGDTLQLQMLTEPVMTSVLPESQAWSSSDERILKVDTSGVVTAVGPGTATITLTTANPDFSATMEITVEHILPTGIEILSSYADAPLVEGDTCTLYAEFTPENTSMRELDWTLSNASDSMYVNLLPMGDSCKVVALKGGRSCIITATSAANGCSASYAIAVMNEGQDDFTNLYFVNTDFEDGTTTGWTVSKPSNASNFGLNNTAAEKGYQGTYFMEAWRRAGSINYCLGNFEWSQTQTVPNGTYIVSALAHAKHESDASVIPQGVYLFAEDQQVEVTAVTPTKYILTVEVTDGTLTLGYRGESCNVNWVACDDFRLLSSDAEVTVTFYDWDGKVLKTEGVKYGQDATAPADPTRECYTFTGWDKAFTNVLDNLDVYAVYEQNILNSLQDAVSTKCYTFSTNGRGAWAVDAAGTRFSTTGAEGFDVDAAHPCQQFSILSANAKDYYLYSVSAKRFVKNGGTLVAGVGDAIEFVDASVQGEQRVMVRFRDIPGSYINVGTDNEMVVGSWDIPDAGNAVQVFEAGLFDATEALAMLDQGETIEDWEDVTGEYIVDADFASTDGWTFDPSPTIRTDLRVVEYWRGYVYYGNASQFVDLPAGTYRLTGKAFYRQGGDANVAPEKSLGYMFAGDNEILVKTLASEGASVGSDLADAATAFYADDKYTNVLIFALDEDSKINIGYMTPFDDANYNSRFIFGAMTLEKKIPVKDKFMAQVEAFAELGQSSMALQSLTTLQAMYSEVLYAANALCDKFSAGENLLKQDVLKSMEDMTAMTARMLSVLEYYDIFQETKSSYYDILDNSTSDDEAKAAFVNAIAAAGDVSTVTAVAEFEVKIAEMEIARQTYVLKAVPADGYTFDYSFLVVNPEMEDGTVGWTGEMDANNNQDKWANINGGFAEKWTRSGVLNDLDFYQELTELPEGNYTFTAYVIANRQTLPDTYEVKGVKLYANGDSVEVHTINVDRNETNYAIGAELISVTTSVKEGESLRIGLSVENTDANWVVLDNAKLYRSMYNPPVYTVTFYDWDGTVLDIQTVMQGKDATVPTDPAREGYAFTGWDKDFTNVQADLFVYAVYTQNSVEPEPDLQYTVEYHAGNNGYGWIEGSEWYDQSQYIVGYTSPLYRSQQGKVEKLRITVIQTSGKEPAKFFCLSELQFYDADGQPIVLTASDITSNADHNTLNPGATDGGGIAALLDGQTSTYFHSAWKNMPSEDHYLEITLPNGGYEAFSFRMLSRARSIEGGYVYEQSHTFPGEMVLSTAVQLTAETVTPDPEPDPQPELDNDAVYYVSQPYNGGTSWAIAEGGSAMTINTKLNITADGADARQQFAFITTDGGKTYYLYHPAEQKYVNKDNTLGAAPRDPVYFMPGEYENTFLIYFDNAHVINTNDTDGLIINRWGPLSGWGKADAGNSCMITRVEKSEPEPEPQPELDNETLYHISQPYRGATTWAIAEGGNALKCNGELGLAANQNDPCQQFAFISYDGGNTHYLYHPAEMKYVNMDGSLNDTPKDPVYFMQGAYENTFVVYFDIYHFINVNENPMLVINQWGPADNGWRGCADGGNSCLITPVGKFDPTLISPILNDGIQCVRKVLGENGVVFIIFPDGSKYTTTGIRIR